MILVLERFKQLCVYRFWKSRLWQWWLERAPVPKALQTSFRDYGIGLRDRGEALMLLDATNPDLFSTHTPSALADATHGWLRDLIALNTQESRVQATTLVMTWIAQNWQWNESSWQPSVLSERLSTWLGVYDALFAKAPLAVQTAVLQSLAQQARHLNALGVHGLSSAARMRVMRAKLWCALALSPKDDKEIFQAVHALGRYVEHAVAADGLHKSRNGSEHAEFLRQLVALRDGLRNANVQLPPELSTVIVRMVGALRALRHGDGGLALFNGAWEENGAWIDMILARAGGRVRTVRRLPESGYERVTSGKSVLIMDVGLGIESPWNEKAHAGLLSFEFSYGRERLIVNSGAPPLTHVDRIKERSPLALAWRRALATTAAHSTLTLADTNMIRINASGGVGRSLPSVAVQRYEKDRSAFIDAHHEGYVAPFGVRHRRILSVQPDGEALFGQDVLYSRGGATPDFMVRWHIYPETAVALLEGGDAVIVRPPSGREWLLRLDKPEDCERGFVLESGVYCANPHDVRRNHHVALHGRISSEVTKIAWRLIKVKR